MADPSKVNFTTEERAETLRHVWKAEREAAAQWHHVFNESIHALAPHMQTALDVNAEDRETFLAAPRAAFEEVRGRRRSQAPVLPGIDLAAGKDQCPALGGSQFGGAGR